MDLNDLKKLGYGTILKKSGEYFCFICGLDGDILMKVSDGTWVFAEDCDLNKFKFISHIKGSEGLLDFVKSS